LPTDNEYESPEDFLKKMDSGNLDVGLSSALRKLSREQIEEVARVLIERDARSKWRPK
jgi:hypothetical protein